MTVDAFEYRNCAIGADRNRPDQDRRRFAFSEASLICRAGGAPDIVDVLAMAVVIESYVRTGATTTPSASRSPLLEPSFPPTGAPT